MDNDFVAHMMNGSNNKKSRSRIFLDKDMRDTLLFLVGVGGVIHEIFFETTERPTLLILFAAMMGLPFLLRANGK